MKRRIIQPGERFGRLVAVRETGRHYITPAGVQMEEIILCQCDCGGSYEARKTQLVYGKARSCGCLMIENRIKHGLARSQVYTAWKHMRDRCQNPNSDVFHLYGGRGVTVCERWQQFENFLADMGHPPSSRHSIDRYPDQDGPYSPDNCRWATWAEQSRNRRNNVVITFNGQTKVLQDWALELGISHSSLSKRVKRWPIERALTEPIIQPTSKAAPTVQVLVEEL